MLSQMLGSDPSAGSDGMNLATRLAFHSKYQTSHWLSLQSFQQVPLIPAASAVLPHQRAYGSSGVCGHLTL